MVYLFADLPQTAVSGGKGSVLARLHRAGYPVPNGFIITPDAFNGDELKKDGLTAVSTALDTLRKDGAIAFAVRSSATSEDSAVASFAGEFETVLNVNSDEEILEAIHFVVSSRENERVLAYTQAQRMNKTHQMAVVVQKMVPSQLSGVLFTADPVTGSHRHMVGNFVHGLGEKLVSGEATGEEFRLVRPKGKLDGPNRLKRYGRSLFKLAQKLEAELNGSQDIEWAIANGKLFLLQARPITTLHGNNPATGEWNDSLHGDFLWTNSNFGEAFPDVMTPLSWSLAQIYAQETIPPFLPPHLPIMGNIGGRFYMNLSLMASMMQALGFSRERMNKESEAFFGHLPEDIEIPIYPFARWRLMRRFLFRVIKIQRTRRQHIQEIDTFTHSLPARFAKIQTDYQAITDPVELANVWSEQLEPLLRKAYRMLQVGTSRYENAYQPLQRQLREQVGIDKAITLLSGVSENDYRLDSLGPLVGLWQVKSGELSGHNYLQLYGHRGPHDLEISYPRPSESPDWLDKQLTNLEGVDVPALLAQQEAKKKQVWQEYVREFPRDAKKIASKLDQAAKLAREREAIRSEVTRFISVMRGYSLHAGALTGLGDGVFYLSVNELKAVLRGSKETAAAYIPARRQTHEHYQSLPPYPTIINGRFDPFQWAQDPNRRSDIFDAHIDQRGQQPKAADLTGLTTISGFPGSSGIVEGVVRQLESMDEASQFQTGEILVTNTTNVGWTLLFPHATAVITDVGAPLSHAAIVARELGIPAVVGCGNATMHLLTGYKIRVNGGQGTVEIIEATKH